MKLSIVVIGDEILLGQVVDTNSGAIARAFGPYGWEVESINVVGDDSEKITASINKALGNSDLVITTGGLGPTKDDITRTVLMEIFGGELIYDEEVAANIREIFEKRGLQLNKLTKEQALVPSSCKVIQNRFGTAPLMWFERGGKVLVSMPGVPFETEGMLHEVVRKIREFFNSSDRFFHKTLIISGISESALAEKLDEFEKSLLPGLHLAYLPQPGLIRLRLDGHNVAEDCFEKELSRLTALAGDLLIFEGDATPAEILLKVLSEQKMTFASAESCTGGNIAHMITSVPGASDCFLGSVVSYSNDVKENILGVSLSDLQACGAVSRSVVEQMAAGVCRATGADCAVATSGIAGPGGGTPEKPVGTVWIAWCVKGSVTSCKFRFPGDRLRVIQRASNEAIITLIKLLKK